jgi:glycosyltransferase involved in cell wall biosynthesis
VRVLHVSSGNLYGGVETMLLAMSRNPAWCPTLRNELALCFEGRLSREIEAGGAPWHRLPTPQVRRPHTVLRARRALTRLLDANSFDRVICHGQWAQAIFGPAVRRAGVPLAMWVHGPLTGRHWSDRWAGWTPPDLAICTSHFTARTLTNLYDEVPGTVVHPPVDVQPSLLSSAEKRRIRDELSTSENAVVIVQVSRVEPWKGHELLVDALGLLHDVPNWVWWLVGGPQRPFEVAYLESVRARAGERRVADRVRLAGERQDVARVLSASDIHCQANILPEPFGIAFVEALAAGLPVVTVAAGGAMEIVDDSCGILVPPGDVSALAAALRRLIDDRSFRERLAGAAPARANAVSNPVTQMCALKDALDRMVAGVEV